MRKLQTFILFMMIAVVMLSIVYIGCKTNDEPTGPSDKAQAYSSQKQPYSYVSIEVTDSGNSIYYIVKVCMKHNYSRGNPSSEMTVSLTTALGSFDQTNVIKKVELTTANYVKNGEDCVTAFLYYSAADLGVGIISAQTNYRPEDPMPRIQQSILMRRKWARPPRRLPWKYW